METVVTETRSWVAWGWAVGDLTPKGPRKSLPSAVMEIVPILILVVGTQVCKFVKTHRKVHFYIHVTVCKLYRFPI